MKLFRPNTADKLEAELASLTADADNIVLAAHRKSAIIAGAIAALAEQQTDVAREQSRAEVIREKISNLLGQ